MATLFANNTFERLTLPGADLSLLKTFDLGRSPEEIFEELKAEIDWRQEDVIIQGRAYKQPRLTAWCGDPGTAYTYSGLCLTPGPCNPLLADIKQRIEAVTNHRFNSALLNLYRGQRDSVGFHADDEPELGPNPVIASLSLGQERTFVLKPRRNRNASPQKIPLPSGSLLVMAGETQKNWLHGIEKENAACGPRINITFRTILGSAPPRSFSR